MLLPHGWAGWALSDSFPHYKVRGGGGRYIQDLLAATSFYVTFRGLLLSGGHYFKHFMVKYGNLRCVH